MSIACVVFIPSSLYLLCFMYIDFRQKQTHNILTTNLAAVVCVCVSVCEKFDQFLPVRSHFDSKRPKIFVRIATFPSATFGPLFSFHCPLFVTKNNNLE